MSTSTKKVSTTKTAVKTKESTKKTVKKSNSTSKKISEIVKTQQEFFDAGNIKSLEIRLTLLEKLKKTVIENEGEIFKALKKDLGKSETESYLTEIAPLIKEINYFLKNLKKLAKPTLVPTPLFLKPGSSWLQPNPIGPVLIISPWNYPFILSLMPLVGALSAGNPVCLKPSEYSENTTKLLVKLFKKNFGEEYVAVLPGDQKVAKELLKQKFAHIFFTGSSNVGREVAKSASQNLTPTTLELGGKSPCIVDKNTNLEIAGKRIVWGKFLNCGQTCVAPDYLLVHEDVNDSFREVLKRNITEFYSEDPIKDEAYGKIINTKHFDRLVKFLSQGKVVFGGDYDKKKLYLSPTIIENPKLKSDLLSEEIFGPILPVIVYKDLEKAIDFIKSKPSPLVIYGFSNDKKFQEKIIQKTTSGSVCFNDVIMQLANQDLPFGGFGESGYGRYYGKASFDTFTNYKSVMRRGFSFEQDYRYPPFANKLERLKNLIKWFG